MKFLKRIPLSLRVPLFTAVLMMLVGFIASQQVLTTLRQVQNTRIKEVAQLQIEALSVALGPLVLRNDIWEVYDTLDRTSGESESRRMVFAAVINEEGNVLAATDPERAPIDSRIDELATGAQNLKRLSVSKESTHIRILAPLVYQGREVGKILTELDVTDLVFERKRATQLLLYGNTAATIVLAILGYLATRRMLLPVSRVIGRMRESADSPEPIPENDIPSGDTEMAQLARSYNTMVRAIEAKTELDKRLAERERFVSLGRLSSSLAHEINNPLGGLLNAADTIREYADSPDVVRESADILVRGLGHLHDVSRATLDQYRHDRTGAILTPEDFDDLKLLIGPETSVLAQRLDWRVEIDAPILAQFLSAPIRQIALNLLLNASEAAGKGGYISLQVSHIDNTMCLKISNTGLELSKVARERLLGTGPVTLGGGVGLRLVRDLISNLRGNITVDHSEGLTLITVMIPVVSSLEGVTC